MEASENGLNLLATALSAHQLGERASGLGELLSSLSKHTAGGCMCDWTVLSRHFETIREPGVPLPAISREYRLEASVQLDQTTETLTVSESWLPCGRDSWQMPDPLTAGLATFAHIDSAPEITVLRGENDVVASLLFGWQGGALFEAEIDGELWDGPFPGFEAWEHYEVLGEDYEGDDTSPLTSGGGHIGLCALAGRYWELLKVSGDRAEWTPMPVTTLDEAKAMFAEDFGTG